MRLIKRVGQANRRLRRWNLRSRGGPEAHSTNGRIPHGSVIAANVLP